MQQLMGDATDSQVERLEGLDAVQTRLEELTTRVESEVTTVVPGGPQPPEVLDAARPLDSDLAQRGLMLRSLYQVSMRNNRANLAYAEWLIGIGVQVRTAPLVPPRMILFDRSVALVPLDPTTSSRGAVIIRQPGVLALLIALFEQNWDLATPLQESHARDNSTGLTDEEHELLRILARGLTDEAAAKRLGVSLRTVRRRMESLMTRLGANSRFEAGMRATERGWLS